MHYPHAIRVKRTGTGTGKVTTDPSDEIIGVDRKILRWVRRQDTDPGDPGEHFRFKSLEGLPRPLFCPPHINAAGDTITVVYDGWDPKTEWKYTIHVTDVPEKGSHGPITSDGSPTIKNK